MSDIVIRVEDLGKRYRLGPRERYRTLRDSVTDTLASPFRSMTRWLKRQTEQADVGDREYLWALRNVSLEIKLGEAIGIIGRNGAGKSTLLKILARITEPTEGYAQVRGRVGSLLEVGTGFHPELTGRENIYLNGAILGMTRAEINRKFDEIVAFAEIEKFLDTPVKHFSSGMYMRLAFAVAAHLEPEILLVDEVLAVGDATFQKKCMGKMDNVAKTGRTVLFVSHNMGAIAQLCPKVVLLHAGELRLISDPETAIAQYLSNEASAGREVDPSSKPFAAALFTRLWVGDELGNPLKSVDVTHEFIVGSELLVRRRISSSEISIRVHNSLGQPLFTTNLSDTLGTQKDFVPGRYRFQVSIPGNFLSPDTYAITIALHRPGIEVVDIHEDALSFEVVESGSNMWQYHRKAYGNILVQLPWEERFLN